MSKISKMTSQDDDNLFDPSECCGNGCANCILDIKPKSTIPNRNYEMKKNALLIRRKYNLIQKSAINTKIIQLKFKLQSPADEIDLILDLPPGHHIMMRAPDITAADNSKKFISRPYSPFFVDTDQLEFEILVNLSPDGKMSKYINSLNIDDLVEFRGPVGSFIHEANASYEHLIIFTHGVAVAPVLRIIDDILENDEDMTRIQFYGCFKNVDDILFRKRLLQDYCSYWNFTSNIYLSQEKCDCLKENGEEKFPLGCEHFKKKLRYGEHVCPYRLDSCKIRKIFDNINVKKCKILLCGSIAFVEQIKVILMVVGFSQDEIVVL